MQSILMDCVAYAHQRTALQLRHHGTGQVAYLEVGVFEGEQDGDDPFEMVDTMETAIQAVAENELSFVSVY
jgi:hypothetical protein